MPTPTFGYVLKYGRKILRPYSFRKENKRPPQFRSKFKYKSHTLKQSGYAFLDGNAVEIGFGIRGNIKRLFEFHKHRDFDVESVKTAVVKRDCVGDLRLCITVLFDGWALSRRVKISPCRMAQRMSPRGVLHSASSYSGNAGASMKAQSSWHLPQ